MKKKLSSILMISFLAVAGIFGISSTLINKQAEETPIIEKAYAVDPSNAYIQTNASGNGNVYGFKSKCNGSQIENYNVYFNQYEVFFYNIEFGYGNWQNNYQVWYIGGNLSSCFETYSPDNNGWYEARCKVAGFYNIFFKPDEHRAYIEPGQYKTTYVNYSSVSSSFTSNYSCKWTLDSETTYSISSGTSGVQGVVTNYASGVKEIKYPANATSFAFLDSDSSTTNITPNSTNYSTYYIWNETSGSNYVGHWGASRTGTFVVGTFNSWQGTDSSILASNNGSSNYYLLQNVSMSSSDEWLIRLVSAWNVADVDYGWSYYDKDYSEAVYQSDLFVQSTSVTTNIMAVANGTYDIHYYVNGNNHKIFGYYDGSLSIEEGYYLCGTNEFTTNDSYPFSLKYGIKMSTGDGVNTAYYATGLGYHISADTKLKPRYHTGNSMGSNTWYNVTLGEEYDYATIDTSDENNVKITKEGYYNFYFKTGSPNMLYIVNVGNVGKYGYLYFPSSNILGNIHLTTKLDDDTVVLNNVALSSITGVDCTTDPIVIDDGGYAKLYKIPIFNLRGANTSAQVTKVVWNDGVETTVTGLPTNASDSPHYYARSGSASDSDGLGAKAVFDIEYAISHATDKSVCNLSQSQASTLKDEYDDATDEGSILHISAKIYTYTSSLDPDDKSNISVSAIYNQIASIADTGKPLGALHTFTLGNLFNDDNVPTIIIIIASSVALLSVTALSILVIKKRKQKEE